MRKRILSVILTLCLALSLSPSVFAATKEAIDQPEVFIKQEGRGTCTLAATAMMLRRTAMLRGDQDWASITQASCRAAFWLGGRGLPYSFGYDGITVGHAFLPGGEANRQILIDLLAEHPEGIVLHARSVPHGILLTDYTDGVFYCADSAVNIPHGRIPLEQAYGTRVENSSAYWYVTSPSVALEPEVPVFPSAALDTAPSESTVSILLSGGEAAEAPTCLIAQAMAEQN